MLFSYFYFDINHLDGRRSASPKCNRTSHVVTPPSTTKCCNCFGPLKFGHWDDTISNQMSEVYNCRVCDDNENYSDDELVPIPKDRLKDSPAILTNVTHRRRRHLRRASTNSIVNQTKLYGNLNGCDKNELELSTTPTSIQTSICDKEKTIIANETCAMEDFELGDDIATTSNNDSLSNKQLKVVQNNVINANDRIRVRGKEELPVLSNDTNIENTTPMPSLIKESKINHLSANISTSTHTNVVKPIPKNTISKMSNATKNHPLLQPTEIENLEATNTQNDSKTSATPVAKVNDAFSASKNNSIFNRMHHMYSTLPKTKKITAGQHLLSTSNRPPFSIPTRITSDGTTIYYICDLPKNVIKGF